MRGDRSWLRCRQLRSVAREQGDRVTEWIGSSAIKRAKENQRAWRRGKVPKDTVRSRLYFSSEGQFRGLFDSHFRIS